MDCQAERSLRLAWMVIALLFSPLLALIALALPPFTPPSPDDAEVLDGANPTGAVLDTPPPTAQDQGRV